MSHAPTSSPSPSPSWLPSTSLTLVSALAQLVGSSFGPSGRDKLLRSKNGTATIITNSGEQILQHISVEHPIAKYIMAALHTHLTVVGDGSTQVLLMLQGSMKASLEYIRGSKNIGHSSTNYARDELDNPSRQRLHRLLRALQQLHRHWMVDGALSRWLVSEKASALPSTGESAKLALLHVVRTVMGQKLSPVAVGVLSTKLVELLLQSRRSSDSSEQLLHEVCTSILSDFPFHLCPGVALAETQVLHGLLLPGNVALRGMKTQLQRCHAVVLHCDVHSNLRLHEAERSHIYIQTRSSAESLAFLSAGEQAAQHWVERFRREGVKLVVCARRIHDSALALLKAADITCIHGVDEDDTRRLAKYLGVSPIDSLEDYTDESTPLPSGSVAAACEIILGGQAVMHIEMDDQARQQNRTRGAINMAEGMQGQLYTTSNGHTLLLCGPSEGMCEQYRAMLVRCLHLVGEWSRTSEQVHRAALSTTSSPTSASVVSSPPHLHIVGGGGSVELSLMFFCDDEARRVSRGETLGSATGNQLRVPSACGNGESSPLHADLAAAYTIISAGCSHVVQTLLQNSHPAAASSSSAAEAAGVGPSTIFPWLHLLPHVRTLHTLLPWRNLGFTSSNPLAAVGSGKIQFQPMHHSLRQPGAGIPSQENLAHQLQVGAAEQAIMDLLPASSLFTVTDTLTRTSTPLFEPLSLKLNVFATFFTLLVTLLRTDQLLPTRSSPSSHASVSPSASLSFRRPPSDPKRIRIRRSEDAANEEEDVDEDPTNQSDLDSD